LLPTEKQAFARGGGGGNGGGKGGGNGGGNGAGNAGGNSGENAGGNGGAKGGHASGSETAGKSANPGKSDENRGKGKGKAGAPAGPKGKSAEAKGKPARSGNAVTGISTEKANPKDFGVSASSLASLNAMRSSEIAQSRASLNSPVGQLGAYRDAVARDDIEAAASAISAAAKKAVDVDVVSTVNAAYGFPEDRDRDQAIAAEANDENSSD
jgi:hypothetical protein